ncbi:MAG: hypothetical protein ACOYUZ_03255 [Patescibacteria group bacterium]
MPDSDLKPNSNPKGDGKSANPASWQNLPSVQQGAGSDPAPSRPKDQSDSKVVPTPPALLKKMQQKSEPVKAPEPAAGPRFVAGAKDAENKKSAAANPVPAVPASPKQDDKPKAESKEKPELSAGSTLSGPVKKLKQGEKKKKKHIPVDVSDVIACSVLFLIALLILILCFLYGAAKAGLINIPFFSSYYQGPAPIRTVEAEPVTWDDFRAKIAGKIIARGVDQGPPYTLLITEEDLTGLLLGAVDAGLRSAAYRVEMAQVAIRSDNIEFYFELTWRDWLHFYIVANLVPEVEDDGTLRFAVRDAQLGDLPLPRDTMLRLVGYFFARDVGIWRIITSDGSGIQSVMLSEKNMQIIVGPLNQIGQ